jgi:hypothetical protein
MKTEMTEMKCEVEMRDVYGRTVYYPVNSVASLFCKLLGSKTLTVSQLKIIRTLGYQISSLARSFDADMLDAA